MRKLAARPIRDERIEDNPHRNRSDQAKKRSQCRHEGDGDDVGHAPSNAKPEEIPTLQRPVGKRAIESKGEWVQKLNVFAGYPDPLTSSGVIDLVKPR